jgi:hypothetical protein
VGLKRFAPDIIDTPLEVKILPLLKTAPVYLPSAAWPNFGTDGALGKINQIEIVPEYEVNLQVR